MKRLPAFIATLAPALLPTLAAAHSGDVDHPGFWATIPHVLTEPDHLLGIVGGTLVVLVIMVLLRSSGRRLVWRRQQQQTVSSVPAKADIHN